MTAYDLFNKEYTHYMGGFMRHLWATSKHLGSPKDYVTRSFNEAIGEYSVEYACNNGFKLSYSDNFTNKNVLDLKQIEMQSGYYLCLYDGHTGEWLVMYYDSRPGAKAAYTKLYDRYFRHQNWFWIMKIS